MQNLSIYMAAILDFKMAATYINLNDIYEFVDIENMGVDTKIIAFGLILLDL